MMRAECIELFSLFRERFRGTSLNGVKAAYFDWQRDNPEWH